MHALRLDHMESWDRANILKDIQVTANIASETRKLEHELLFLDFKMGTAQGDEPRNCSDRNRFRDGITSIIRLIDTFTFLDTLRHDPYPLGGQPHHMECRRTSIS